MSDNYVFYSALRNYPTLTKKDYENLRSYFFKRVKHSDFFRASQEICVGINLLPWDSQHFGLPMARLDVLAKEGANKDAVTKLVSEAVIEFKHTTGCQHFSIEIDMDNYLVMNACFAAGFQALDFRRTYIFSALNKQWRYNLFYNSIRKYEASDKNDVLDLFRKAGFDTRFTRDEFLEQKKTQQLYVLWAEKLLAAYPEKSNVLVYERNNKIEACGAIGEKDLTPLGVGRVYASGSIYAASARGVGAYGAVLWRLTEEALAKYGLADTTVSLNSSAATRVLEGVRPNRSVAHACLRLYVQ